MNDTIQVPDLSGVDTRELWDALRMVDEPRFALPHKNLWEVIHQLRVVLASELRRRGEDDEVIKVELDHGGHEVWTDFEGSSGDGWSVMCDCGLAVNDVPSKDEAERHGSAHVGETGGMWASWGDSAS